MRDKEFVLIGRRFQKRSGHFELSLPDNDDDDDDEDTSFFFSSPLTSLWMFCKSLVESFTLGLGDPVLWLLDAEDLELLWWWWWWCSDTGLVSRLADTEDDSASEVMPPAKAAVVSRLELWGMETGSW